MKLATTLETLRAHGMEDAAALLEDLHIKTRKKRAARRDRAPRVSAPITLELREEVLHLARTTKLAQHQIAARLNINPGRVNEILKASLRTPGPI